MSTHILQEKLELIQWVSTLEDGTIIKKLIKLRNETTKDWWDELSDDEKAEIQIGLKQIEQGEIVIHEEVMKVFDKWK